MSHNVVMSHISIVRIATVNVPLVKFFGLSFKKMSNNVAAPQDKIVRTVLDNDINVVTPHISIVRDAPVNDPCKIFVCLQKDVKRCRDAG